MTSSKWPIFYLMMILLGLSGVGCVPPGGETQNEENDADFRAGLSRKQAGNHARAIELFERALQRNPRSAAAHFELGLIYYQNVTNPVAAIYHFDRVQRLRPSFSRIDVVRQLIKVCKQEMVRDAMGGFTVQMQRELERLERLTQENEVLRQENAALRREIAQVQAQANRHEPMELAAGNSAEVKGLGKPAGNRTEPDWVGGAGQGTRTGAMTTYTVRQGETLYSIARRNGLSEAELLAANPGVVPRRMPAGQVLRIPAR
jgi:tetratricopeptide (TPR) repeat protein